MNSVPVSYQQCDVKWGEQDYSAPGEKTDVCESGCGPTCVAMILSTFLNRIILPSEIASWSLSHGFKAVRQGTYYSFFAEVGRSYGVPAVRLNYKNLRKFPSPLVHSEVLERLSRGELIVACMGKGNWTSAGHYILLYGIDVVRDIAYVNDPASTKENRTRGSWQLLQKEVKYYFAFSGGENMESKNVSSWALQAWNRKREQKILDGSRPKDYLTREEFATAQDRNDVRMEQRIREIIKEMNNG